MITIIGSGIAGLTSALELVEKGYKITIYEKDKIAGGMAKSYNINGIPTEHSWRGYMSFYYNIFNILKRIPVDSKKPDLMKENDITKEEVEKNNWVIFKDSVYDITDFLKIHPGGSIIKAALGKNVEEVWNNYFVSWHLKNKKVISVLTKNKLGDLLNKNHLSAYGHLTPIKMDKLYNINVPNQFNPFDYLYILYHYLLFLFSNKRSEYFYKTKILDVYNTNKISKSIYDYLVTFVSGPGLGLDSNIASISSMYFYFNGYFKHIMDKHKWFVMKKPTNEAFIDPLVKLLLGKGVKFIYNSELQKINYSKNIITSIIVNNKKIVADEFIIAINPNNLVNIFTESKMDNLADIHSKIHIVNNQISFRLGFNKKIKFKDSDRGYVLIDSINNITFYPQDNFFKTIDLNDKIKSLWSGTCVHVYDNNYSKSEFIEKIIEQFIVTKDLQDEIKKYNDFEINRDDIVYSEIYEDWYEKDGLVSKNPKWVNTYFNEEYKPNSDTEYNNLYLAGGHTNTSFKIWSMESACESGKIVANLILKKYNKQLIDIYTHTPPAISNILSPIDDILYQYGQPSIVTYLFTILLVILIFKITNKIVNK
jgi:cytochrome b involved in lipid metabolism